MNHYKKTEADQYLSDVNVSESAQTELGVTGYAANFSRFSQRAVCETDLMCFSHVTQKKKKKLFRQLCRGCSLDC